MERQVMAQVQTAVKDFWLPRYREIPDVGLYLEQVAKYINDSLSPLIQAELTGSMISNYVKKGLVASPIKKQYSREQIAYLLYIAVVKSVLPMEDIRLMVGIQQKTYESEIAYNYFCTELECVLSCVFERQSDIGAVQGDVTDEKLMLRNTIIAVAHKVYLDKLFAAIRAQGAAKGE